MSSHPPKEDKENKIASSQKSRKYMNVTVYFLDDSNHVFQIQTKATGQALFEKTCKYINLLEVDYFCLEFEDGKGIKCWLDVLKPLGSQISTLFPTMYFQVKFYSPDPAQLEDELTRYLFGLQIRKDLASGALQCNDNTAAVIISYIVQADLGDHDEKKCLDSTYFSNNKFLPYQDSEIQRKVVENHMKLMGQSPAEADLNLLETSRRCELYGIKMTPAKDHEGVPLNLAVSHLGVLIFQNFTKINTFSWPKIRKLSFKRKKFLIKLHPEGYGYYKDTAEYYFEGRNECKNFWKKCIENHTFFRCSDAKQGMRQKTKIFSRGSSFRYSGRTQKQVTDFVRENCFKRPPFQRSTSLRTASTSSSPSRLLNTFTSAQPLIPVTSQSCGSISDVAREVHPSKILSTSEPTTPHVAQDLIRPINNNCPSTESPTGLISPDFACQQEGFQSPDILGQDTDDNISHDSYHVLEKETIQTNTECMQTNPNNSDNNTANTDNTAQPVTNGNVEDEGAKGDHISSKNINFNDLEKKENVMYKNKINETSSILYDKDLQCDEKLELLDRTDLVDSTACVEHKKSLKKYETTINAPQELIPDGISTETEYAFEKISNVGSSDNLDNVVGSKFEDQISNVNEDASVDSKSSSDKNSTYLQNSELTIGLSKFYFESPLSKSILSRKKMPTDEAYFFTKELLMTERTYRKDLEIINVLFRDEFNKQESLPHSAIDLMLSVIDPLYEIHCSLLRDLEQRIALWEGRPMKSTQSSVRGIGEIMLHNKSMSEIYRVYFNQLPKFFNQLIKDLDSSPDLVTFYQKFEANKICYLPLTSFLLRPIFRLTYYCYIVESLLHCSNAENVDQEHCLETLVNLKDQAEEIENKITTVVNFVKLMELQRILTGFPDLLQNNREFIREGCLLKLSNKGSRQYMFFLFSDILLYASKVFDEKLNFEVQGKLLLHDVQIEETEPVHGLNNCFVVCSPSKHLVIAANSKKDQSAWISDLNKAVLNAKNEWKSKSSSLASKSDDDEGCESSDDDPNIQTNSKLLPHHVNTSVHVCWHRNISISFHEILFSMKHCLSGCLLRKFKNNDGWQKLWVVLANRCLFFYKSFQDDSPLASLPLAGYQVLPTSAEDSIYGKCIFKLQYKNHCYFFKAESEHTFERWIEVIHQCTLMEEEKTHL